MTVQLVALIAPGISFLSVGEERKTRARFAEAIERFRAQGFSPVEVTPEIVAPCRGPVEILP